MALCDRCSSRLQRDNRAFKSTTDEVLVVQSQVKRIDREIQRLSAQRVLLQRRLNSIAASTVVLPYEILSHVFKLVCPPLDVTATTELGSTPADSVAKHGGLTYPTMPLSLAAVSSQWRDIALTTPQLWSSAAFTLYQSRNIPNARALQALATRSAPCPLSLSLIFATTDEARDRLGNDIPPSLDVLRVFLSHSTRWGSLKIDGLPPEWIPVLRQARNATPRLHHLWLCPYDNSREQQILDIFTHAPHLRRVTLDNTFLSAILLPWSGLTHLKVSWVSIDECAEMLRRCPSLVECDFSRILSNAEFHPLPRSLSLDAASDTDPSAAPLILESLHTLAWSYAGDAWEFQLFDRIRFPHLRVFKLKLRYDLTQFTFILSVLRRMLAHSSTHVHTLDWDLGCPWVDVVDILRDLKGLRVLRWVDEQDSQIVNTMINALVSPPSPLTGPHSVFLPGLTQLELRGHCHQVDVAWVKWIVDTLKKRWDLETKTGPSPSRLNQVTLALTCSNMFLVEGETLVKEELRVLEMLGMCVRIVHHHSDFRAREGWLDEV